jgi:hypothetical protein
MALSTRRKHKKKTVAVSKGRTAPPSRRAPAPEAFDHYDEISAEAVKALQKRADRVLKKGKWTIVDGYVGEL